MNRKPSSRWRATVDVVEQPSRLARCLGHGRDVADRVEIAAVVELAWDTEAMRQVGRADEQDVHAVDRGELRGVLDGARQFDLDDACDLGVDRADVGVGPLPEARAAHGQGESARPVRRVVHERDRLGDLGRGVVP